MSTERKFKTPLKKRIADRNRRFVRMSPDRQRVQIARDILAQIETNRFIAKSGTYLRLFDGAKANKLFYPWGAISSDETARLSAEAKQTQIQTALANIRCKVCAIGSAFVAAVDRANECTVSQMRGTNDDFYMRRYLRKWFSTKQLGLIESAFERDTNFAARRRVLASERAAAVDFGRRIQSDRERLIAIWQNVIDNDGEFRP